MTTGIVLSVCRKPPDEPAGDLEGLVSVPRARSLLAEITLITEQSYLALLILTIIGERFKPNRMERSPSDRFVVPVSAKDFTGRISLSLTQEVKWLRRNQDLIPTKATPPSQVLSCEICAIHFPKVIPRMQMVHPP